MILYVNACVRSDSRTKRLSEYLLSKLHDDMTEHWLCEIDFPKADEGFLRLRVIRITVLGEYLVV